MNLLPVIVSVIALMFSGYGLLHDTYGGSQLFGAISFPTSLDTFTNPNPTDSTATVSHSSQHSNANDAIEALEAKVGIDGSAVTSSHDYKLSGVTGSDLACSLTGTETLTNKTLTSPFMTNITSTSSYLYGTTTFVTNNLPWTLTGNDISIVLGSDATGDLFYRNSSGNLARLGIGTAGQFLIVDSGLPAWNTASPELDVDNYNVNASGDSSITFNIDANDEIVMWAEFDEVTSCISGSGQRVTGSLKYRQGTEAATTTLVTVNNANSSVGGGCNAVAIGYFTATTSTSINVAADLTAGDTSRLLVQHFIK